MKKILIISLLTTLSVFSADSFLDLGEPKTDEFMPDVHTQGAKYHYNISEDFKKGKIIVSLSKNEDFELSDLSKNEFKYLVSYFISTIDSKNSPDLFLYSWEDINGEKHSKICKKHMTPIDKNKLKKMSKCAIQEELGTTNVEEYAEHNNYIVVCKDVKE